MSSRVLLFGSMPGIILGLFIREPTAVIIGMTLSTMSIVKLWEEDKERRSQIEPVRPHTSLDPVEDIKP